jgi:hypothetical protein
MSESVIALELTSEVVGLIRFAIGCALAAFIVWCFSRF